MINKLFYLLMFCFAVVFFTSCERVPDVELYPDVTSGVAPLVVKFKSNPNYSYGQNGYNWDFGDGEFSYDPGSTSHTYTKAGTYTVTLSVNLKNKYSTDSRTITVTEPTVAKPVAGFTASTANGAAPLSIVFTNTSTGTVDSYAWTFGDGGTSTSQSPNHTFTTAGTYTVTLVVTNKGGSSTATLKVTVTVKDPVSYKINTLYISHNFQGKYYIVIAWNWASVPSMWDFDYCTLVKDITVAGLQSYTGNPYSTSTWNANINTKVFAMTDVLIVRAYRLNGNDIDYDYNSPEEDDDIVFALPSMITLGSILKTQGYPNSYTLTNTSYSSCTLKFDIVYQY